jgi:hypothetical protein
MPAGSCQPARRRHRERLGLGLGLLELELGLLGLGPVLEPARRALQEDPCPIPMQGAMNRRCTTSAAKPIRWGTSSFGLVLHQENCGADPSERTGVEMDGIGRARIVT